jgi:hypothetical protein
MSEYRVIQDGQPVAWSDSLREIAHYALVYGKDGPVTIQYQLASGRWVKVKELKP